MEIDEGEVVNVFVRNGLKVKNDKLILNSIEALDKLLKTDEDFNCVGQEHSVGKKMFDLNAHESLDEIMEQQNE